MQKREDTLREALAKNVVETALWKNYKAENDTAIDNLDRFRKYLTVDVMVPIGRKAYMPGQLIHTNEVLVGHYQGYFSKCSAHKAKEVCEYRVKTATEHLNKLRTEADLWQNKLETPYAAGVFPTSNEREIIEDYDEEKEKLWREKHKLYVKQAKLREKAGREQEDENGQTAVKKVALTDEEMLKKLNEAELMEEIENELESLEIDDVSNETIKKLMAGEMILPLEKPRLAHTPKRDQTHTIVEPIQIVDKNSNNKNGFELQGIIKKTDLEFNSVRTNNNHQPNPELEQLNNIHRDESDAVVEDLPQEVQVIKEQAKFLSVSDQIDFYEFQIKIMRQKLLTLPLKTQDDIDQKVHILNVLETLEELLEIAEDTAEAQEEEEIVSEKEAIPEELSEIVQETKENNIPIAEKEQKRRISFALQNETLEFRRNETVSEMLPKPQRQDKDIVQLVEPLAESSAVAVVSPVNVDRKQNIIAKVAQNLKFIEETQSTQDFKLVDQILGGFNTLHIHFQHSTIPDIDDTKKIENFECDNIPSSPADFYQAYLQIIENQDTNKSKSISEQIIFANAYSGEEKVKVPILKETDRSQAYQDERKEFYNPATNTKSILRNKSAVESEQHNLNRKTRTTNNKKVPKKKKKSPINEEEYTSAYYKVMNEVVEKPLTEPEPLPECKYIDAHTPKKRVSRFKQSRRVTENS